jgi:hypothetical protein
MVVQPITAAPAVHEAAAKQLVRRRIGNTSRGTSSPFRTMALLSAATQRAHDTTRIPVSAPRPAGRPQALQPGC